MPDFTDKTIEEQIEHWIKTQYGTAGDTQKLKSFIHFLITADRQQLRKKIKDMVCYQQPGTDVELVNRKSVLQLLKDNQ